MLTALVLGGSKHVAQEREAALKLFTPDIVVFTNHSGMIERGPVQHWATFHPELMPKWILHRAKNKLPKHETLWCPVEYPTPPAYTFRRVENWRGSSGMLATRVAIELGATHVVLAGVPLESAEGHFDRPWESKWYEASKYREDWLKRSEALIGRVKSMSGWTRSFLGEPTREWLKP